MSEEWQKLTEPGQIKKGDEVLLYAPGIKAIWNAKEILNPGTDKEEVILHKQKNLYFITSMAINGTSWASDIWFKSKGKFIHIPIEDVTKPIDGATVMMDRWWTTIKEGHISIYIGGSKKSSMGSYRTYSPQCNIHEKLADRGNGAVYLPIVYFVDLLAGEQW